MVLQVTVGKGVADLVLLPVEQYRRDGRVLRGLRKGTQSFLRAVTVETLHTSHRVASFVARTLDDIVAQPGSRASLRGLEYYDEQPTGVLDSLEHAYDALVKEVQVGLQELVHLVCHAFLFNCLVGPFVDLRCASNPSNSSTCVLPIPCS